MFKSRPFCILNSFLCKTQQCYWPSYPGHFPSFLDIFNLILTELWSQSLNNDHLSARLPDIVTNDQTWSRGTKLISAAGDQAGIMCPVKFLLTRLKRLGGARHCDQSTFVGFPFSESEFVPRLCPVLGPILPACWPGADCTVGKFLLTMIWHQPGWMQMDEAGHWSFSQGCVGLLCGGKIGRD